MAKRKRCTRPAYKARYLAYKTENRAAKNKARKIAKHLMKHPNDRQSSERIAPNYPKKIKTITPAYLVGAGTHKASGSKKRG